MKNKFIVAGLVIAMSFSLAACGGSKTNDNVVTSESKEEEVEADANDEVATPEVSEEENVAEEESPEIAGKTIFFYFDLSNGGAFGPVDHSVYSVDCPDGFERAIGDGGVSNPDNLSREESKSIKWKYYGSDEIRINPTGPKDNIDAMIGSDMEECDYNGIKGYVKTKGEGDISDLIYVPIEDVVFAINVISKEGSEHPLIYNDNVVTGIISSIKIIE